jgi:Contractile injection system spike tip protein
MMSSFVLIDFDEVKFDRSFGAATVVVLPGFIRGSGPATVNGTRVCVEGDETRVSVPGCPYFTPSFPSPGTGTLKIKSLARDQKAEKARSGKTPVLLVGGVDGVGSSFEATFDVETPATLPRPPLPPDTDKTLKYTGTGKFSTQNRKLTGV